MLSRRNNAINKSYIKNGEILWIIFLYKLYFILFWASISQFDDDDDILFSRQTALSDMRLIAHNKHLLCPAKNGGLWLIIWFCCLPSRFNAQTFCHNSIFFMRSQYLCVVIWYMSHFYLHFTIVESQADSTPFKSNFAEFIVDVFFMRQPTLTAFACIKYVVKCNMCARRIQINKSCLSFFFIIIIYIFVYFVLLMFSIIVAANNYIIPITQDN